jgi:hypothetical protein
MLSPSTRNAWPTGVAFILIRFIQRLKTAENGGHDTDDRSCAQFAR